MVRHNDGARSTPRQVDSIVTALSALLSARDRKRLLERLRDLREVDQLMRQSGSLAGPDEPAPLHRTGAIARLTENVSTPPESEK